MRAHRQQPARLSRPWDSPGKNTGMGCHFLLQCMKVKSESEDAQSCPTLSDPMDCSLPGSSVHGIFQAKVLEWDAIAFSPLEHCLQLNRSPNPWGVALPAHRWCLTNPEVQKPNPSHRADPTPGLLCDQTKLVSSHGYILAQLFSAFSCFLSFPSRKEHTLDKPL